MLSVCVLPFSRSVTRWCSVLSVDSTRLRCSVSLLAPALLSSSVLTRDRTCFSMSSILFCSKSFRLLACTEPFVRLYCCKVKHHITEYRTGSGLNTALRQILKYQINTYNAEQTHTDKSTHIAPQCGISELCVNSSAHSSLNISDAISTTQVLTHLVTECRS